MFPHRITSCCTADQIIKRLAEQSSHDNAPSLLCNIAHCRILVWLHTTAPTTTVGRDWSGSIAYKPKHVQTTPLHQRMQSTYRWPISHRHIPTQFTATKAQKQNNNNCCSVDRVRMLRQNLLLCQTKNDMTRDSRSAPMPRTCNGIHSTLQSVMFNTQTCFHVSCS